MKEYSPKIDEMRESEVGGKVKSGQRARGGTQGQAELIENTVALCKPI